VSATRPKKSERPRHRQAREFEAVKTWRGWRARRTRPEGAHRGAGGQARRFAPDADSARRAAAPSEAQRFPAVIPGDASASNESRDSGSCFARRNDGDERDLAAPFARGCFSTSRLSMRGRRKAGCALHPRSRVNEVVEAHEHTGPAEAIRLSCAAVYGYTSLLGSYALLPPSPALDANLTTSLRVSGPTISPSARRPRQERIRSTASAPRRTLRNALEWTGCGRI